MSTVVFGHTNPDTDAIASAMVFASFLRKTGVPAEAFCLGQPGPETQFVLKTLKLVAPEPISALPGGSAVALVDHNEASQSIDNLPDLRITHIIDHHKLGGLATSEPLYLRIEPLGCTATILAQLYQESHVQLDSWEAGLLLSAILSDTLSFRSPTTTATDRQIAHDIQSISSINELEEYAAKMFQAKSDLGDMPAGQILKLDYKRFEFGGHPYGLGVMETTNPGYAFARKQELIEAMRAERDKGGLDGVFLFVVDILRETNQALVAGPDEEAVLRGAFGAEVVNGVADLGARISRKKQIVPALEAYLS